MTKSKIGSGDENLRGSSDPYHAFAVAVGQEGMTMQSLKLFQVYSTSKRLVNHLDYETDVRVRWVMQHGTRKLFGAGGSLRIPYNQVIENYATAPRAYFVCGSCCAAPCECGVDVGPGDHPAYIPSELAVEELFTASEAEAVAEFLRRHTVYAGVTVKPVTLLIPNTWKCLVVLPAPIDDDYDPGNALVILDRRLPFSINGYVNERVAPVDHA